MLYCFVLCVSFCLFGIQMRCLINFKWILGQKIALSWMVQKETASLFCSGGILADDQVEF